MSRRTYAANVALALFSGCLGLAVGEVALRVLLPTSFVPAARVFDRERTVLLDCYPTNPRGYFDLDLREPTVRARYAAVAPARLDKVAARAPWAVETRYNSLGFREVEPAPRVERRVRVVVLGDSFTEGEGVNAEDVLTQVLQRHLDEEAPHRYEVRNAGRRGTDFPEMNSAFEDALRYEPDLLVYAMVLNDAERSAEFNAGQAYVDDWILRRQGGLDADEGAPTSFLLAFVRTRWQARELDRQTTRWYREMYGAANQAGWDRTRRYLRAMNGRQRQRGAQFLIALWPLLVGLDGGYPFDGPHEAIRRACLEDGIACLDLRPALAGVPTQGLWVHDVDRHPNEVANALVARHLLHTVLSMTTGGTTVESPGPARERPSR